MKAMRARRTKAPVSFIFNIITCVVKQGKPGDSSVWGVRQPLSAQRVCHSHIKVTVAKILRPNRFFEMAYQVVLR